MNFLSLITMNVFYRGYCFYRDGFRAMTLGRTLWAVILLKLFIMFALLRLFFFPDFLGGMKKQERGEYVRNQLIERTTP